MKTESTMIPYYGGTSVTWAYVINEADPTTPECLDTPPEKDWKRTRFVSGGPTQPNEKTRIKNRKKRKK